MQQYTAKQMFFAGLGLPLILGFLGAGILFKSTGFVSAEEQHIAGNKNAKIKLVEYSDFECPFCERAYPTFKQLIAEYGDKISIEYKHYPLGFHKNAQKAAEASECAGEQGKFWQFHDKIFENQKSLSPSALKQWAGDIKLNTAKFNSCLDSGKYAAKVNAHFTEGQSKGVNGTPTTYINGEEVVGAQPYEAFKAVIDKLLQ